MFLQMKFESTFDYVHLGIIFQSEKKECKILDISFRIILIQEEKDVFTNITIRKMQAECLSDFNILLNINSPILSKIDSGIDFGK